MTLTFPRTDIFTSHPIITNSFDLKFRQQKSRRADGITTVVDFGVPIWVGSFTSARMEQDDCIDLETMLQSLGGAALPFHAFDTRRPRPRRYQSTSFGNTGTIWTLGADGKSLSIQDLDPNFVLSRGDRFSVSIGSIRHLFAVQEQAVADGNGRTGLFEISPHFDPALAAGTAIGLLNPSVRMTIEPGSIQYSDAGSALGTVAFSAVQSL